MTHARDRRRGKKARPPVMRAISATLHPRRTARRARQKALSPLLRPFRTERKSARKDVKRLDRETRRRQSLTDQHCSCGAATQAQTRAGVDYGGTPMGAHHESCAGLAVARNQL